MTFDHKVKHNGKWHLPGAEFPGGDPRNSVENKPFSFKKTEITRMSTADLKNLGKEEGIENAENMTGAELKKALFDRLNL